MKLILTTGFDNMYAMRGYKYEKISVRFTLRALAINKRLNQTQIRINLRAIVFYISLYRQIIKYVKAVTIKIVPNVRLIQKTLLLVDIEKKTQIFLILYCISKDVTQTDFTATSQNHMTEIMQQKFQNFRPTGSIKRFNRYCIPKTFVHFQLQIGPFKTEGCIS